MSTGPEWQALRRGLEAMAERVADEIRTYPRPITACDAQFNHLLELRRQLPHELDHLDAAAKDPAATVAHFIAASLCAAELSAELAQSSIPQPA
jgi:hypothetical protein